MLSLFPGIGMLDMAFEEAGFCVVRGPDLLWGGDVCRFHPPAGRFDGIIGGDPCPAHSRLRFFVESNGLSIAADLSSEYERILAEAEPRWFLRENVPGAKALAAPGYTQSCSLVRDVWCGGATRRLRRFWFGTRGIAHRFQIVGEALHRPDPDNAVLASGGAPDGWKPTARHLATRKGKSVTGFKTAAFLKKARRLQGLPEQFLEKSPLTVAGKIKVIGNGVPLPMGRAVALAVVAALQADRPSEGPARSEPAGDSVRAQP